MSSGGVIKRSGGLPHLVSKVPAQVLVGAELDLSAREELAELQLHGREADEARRAAWEKLDEKIDIAVRALLSTACRSEESQHADALPSAEGGEGLTVDIQGNGHLVILASQAVIVAYPCLSSSCQLTRASFSSGVVSMTILSLTEPRNRFQQCSPRWNHEIAFEAGEKDRAGAVDVLLGLRLRRAF